jgi:hypothetical protein
LLSIIGSNLVELTKNEKNNPKNKEDYYQTKYENIHKAYLERYFLIIYFKIFQPSDITKYIKIKIIRIPAIIAI